MLHHVFNSVDSRVFDMHVSVMSLSIKEYLIHLTLIDCYFIFKFFFMSSVLYFKFKNNSNNDYENMNRLLHDCN